MCRRIRGSAPWPTEPKPTITRRLRNWASFPISNPCAAIVFVSLSPATFADSVNSRHPLIQSYVEMNRIKDLGTSFPRSTCAVLRRERGVPNEVFH